MTSLRHTNVGLVSSLFNSISRWAVNASGYQKFGLFRDDLLSEDDPVVAEALRRLDPIEQDRRIFRMKIATQLSLQQQILPREQWTNSETEPRYLQGLIQTVAKEMAERKKFEHL
ncbi:hypothetical protein CAOG_01268 [Capsaspora owczarzaki ATCC 30864]|uniref:Cytochrome b-c1 complex subunit 7 n=1 Tax=Capsaspora owczarzaki (strain ATCC 30864) TaxID=595528 RepID=A0A0D2WK02_CAPO3|nr:hypothetical protein CAOG_01268 [Capsaspora owczarzaki ATCC 30864]KJE89843.1 hypothetical protein CAOG_001268 [Capsaspora owczarzaki ATCC 30864]|eukprot:XP_004349788.1 hypothetical protein CAOG_01268 [Capsaspora owczarzaki ATCC 30864]